VTQDLTVIPKAELRRALRTTTHRAVTAATLMLIGFAGLATAVWGHEGLVMQILTWLSGVSVTATGGVALSRAVRARATIKARLSAQQLPVARLLDK
jgi:hypothetical protein